MCVYVWYGLDTLIQSWILGWFQTCFYKRFTKDGKKTCPFVITCTIFFSWFSRWSRLAKKRDQRTDPHKMVKPILSGTLMNFGGWSLLGLGFSDEPPDEWWKITNKLSQQLREKLCHTISLKGEVDVFNWILFTLRSLRSKFVLKKCVWELSKNRCCQGHMFLLNDPFPRLKWWNVNCQFIIFEFLCPRLQSWKVKITSLKFNSSPGHFSGAFPVKLWGEGTKGIKANCQFESSC